MCTANFILYARKSQTQENTEVIGQLSYMGLHGCSFI